MRKPIPSTVLAPNGKPAAYYFFEGGTRRWGDTTPFWYGSGAVDTKNLLPTYTWRGLMTGGRFLFANVPMLRGALNEQANYAFPLERHWQGADEDFGVEAAHWLKNEYDPHCGLRGFPFDAEMISRLRLFGSSVDGDIMTVLATDPDTGAPRQQLVRAHRVGDRNITNGGTLPNGPFRGDRIDNGMISDSYGRNVGFLILGDKPEQDVYVSTRGEPELPAGLVLFRPSYPDQVRGITEFVASLNSFEDLKRLSEYEMRAQELFASQGIIEKNETGFADETQDAIMRPVGSPPTDTTGTATGLVTETFEAGLVRYFRSGTGSGLEAFRADRPSSDAANFEARIVARAFYGLEWDPNFALMLKEPGGAWARITLTKINRRLSRIQAAEARIKHRCDLHALAHAIYVLGILPEPSDGDFFSWGYRGPARITADSGNEAASKRNDYILGLRNMEMHCIEEGRDWKNNRIQKHQEAIDLLTRARAILTMFPELVTIQAAAKFVEDTNPTGTPAPAAVGAVQGNGASTTTPAAPPEEGDEDDEGEGEGELEED
jgi:Phage portal protein, lambda family